jgi:hypothetical protein
VGQQGSASGSLLLDLDGFEVVLARRVGGEWQVAVQSTATVVRLHWRGVRAEVHGPPHRPDATRRLAGEASTLRGAIRPGAACWPFPTGRSPGLRLWPLLGVRAAQGGIHGRSAQWEAAAVGCRGFGTVATAARRRWPQLA